MTMSLFPLEKTMRGVKTILLGYAALGIVGFLVGAALSQEVLFTTGAGCYKNVSGNSNCTTMVNTACIKNSDLSDCYYCSNTSNTTRATYFCAKAPAGNNCTGSNATISCGDVDYATCTTDNYGNPICKDSGRLKNAGGCGQYPVGCTGS